MQIFDTKVQYLKYQVLREIARLAWYDELADHILDVPEMLIPGKKPTMRCCVYKERAILAERCKLAMGRTNQQNVIRVIDIACDECPMGGYEVTNACRGCLAHRCENACKFGAISLDKNFVAVIDKDKCKECGACAKACPYTAIIHRSRPCEAACRIHAVRMNEDKSAAVDPSLCISCGSCVYMCPFGAISDASAILDVIQFLKDSANGYGDAVIAVVAPAIASQFDYAKPGQLITALRQLGFDDVAEVALGADMAAEQETAELIEKGFLISSCCPAFVSYVENTFPEMKQYISGTPSPMAMIGKYLKEKHGSCKVVFIGPCTAKKSEIRRESVRPFVDAAITFEELQALLDSKDIHPESLPETPLSGASRFGRGFAVAGGLTAAIRQGILERGETDFKLIPCVCNGIDECRMALLKKIKGVSDVNFIEGMACVGGCTGGAGCLVHSEKSRLRIEEYSKASRDKTIGSALLRL